MFGKTFACTIHINTEYNRAEHLHGLLDSTSFRGFPREKISAWPLNLGFVLPGRRGRDLCDSWSIATYHPLSKLADPALRYVRIVENPFFLFRDGRGYATYWDMCGGARQARDVEFLWHCYLEVGYGDARYILDRTICQYDFADAYPVGIFCAMDDLPPDLQAYYLYSLPRYMSSGEITALTRTYLEYEGEGLIARARHNDPPF